jgi:hypothetical protein
MIDAIPASPEALKAKVTVLLNEPDRSVSTIYTSYVRPFGQFTGTFPVLLFPEHTLRSHPATLTKVRFFLYQLMVQLDVFAQSQFPDPLPSDVYPVPLDLVRSISPLAVAIGGELFTSFFTELRTVHCDRWPATIIQLESDIGVSQTDSDFVVPVPPGRRTHYHEASSSVARSPKLGSGAVSRVVRVHIKKTRHGPSAENVRLPQSLRECRADALPSV